MAMKLYPLRRLSQRIALCRCHPLPYPHTPTSYQPLLIHMR